MIGAEMGTVGIKEAGVEILEAADLGETLVEKDVDGGVAEAVA